MEEDIQNYSTTVMFRGTPCTSTFSLKGASNETLNKKLSNLYNIAYQINALYNCLALVVVLNVLLRALS